MVVPEALVCLVVSVPAPHMVQVRFIDTPPSKALFYSGLAARGPLLIDPTYSTSVSSDPWRATITLPDGRKVDFGKEPKQIDCPPCKEECSARPFPEIAVPG